MSELRTEPYIVARLETEARWVKPMPSWNQARDLAKKQLLEKGRRAGAEMLVFDRAEVEEDEECICLRMFAIAWAGSTNRLFQQLESTTPGIAATISSFED